MWKGHKVSVIFPTYNEKDSIREAIEDFFQDGYVDEIVVVNNNAAPGTSEEVAKTRAREVFETKQGYGWAIRRGFDEVTGDYIIVSEPDGTFMGKDVLKLLAYSDDFDAVLGTRTSRELIWEGANMGFFLKCGNVAVAKMTEFLFNSSILTDMGCTMRLLKRPVVERMKPFFRIGGSHFGPEMLLILIKQRIRFMEIPVNYRERVGESSVTGDMWKAIRLGLRMIALVLRARFTTLYGRMRDEG
ncbi:MAG: glycosyltransferase family 2 protein [Planctomycetes bacterium]|nr:glycosyltransferase family 2 protein [Planctomycetota bacterium]